jgi:hypothetical protein
MIAKRFAFALLFITTSLFANAENNSEFARSYIAALIAANEANAPFAAMSHVETGTKAHIAEFIEQSRLARAALAKAIVEVEPYTRSRNQKIAKGAILAKNVFEARQQLCDRWTALYTDMGKPDAKDEEIADRIVALRAQIGFIGQELGESAIAAAWGMVKLDPTGKPHGWAISWGDRRAALKQLRATFGNDVSKGPKAGQNYLETAASALASFLGRDDWADQTTLPGTPRKRPLN